MQSVIWYTRLDYVFQISDVCLCDVSTGDIASPKHFKLDTFV